MPGSGSGRQQAGRGASGRRAAQRPRNPHTALLPPQLPGVRQHTSAYVSIRQHTSERIRQHTSESAYVSIRQRARIRQHTSAYASIRQHTSVHVSIRAWYIRPPGARRLSPGFHTRTVAISGRGPVLRFIAPMLAVIGLQLLRQYFYVCTSKASKLSTWGSPCQLRLGFRPRDLQVHAH